MSAIAFQAWLAGEQDFTQGAQLYAQHPRARPALVALFARAGAGRFTASQLEQELARLLAEEPAVSVAPAVALPVAELSADVAALTTERLALFKQASHLQGTLRLLPSDAERLTAACTIKANFRRIEEIWDALTYHAQHGALPPVVEAVLDAVLAGDPAAQTRRRNTLRTYLSSRRGSDEKRASWAAELAELERRLRA